MTPIEPCKVVAGIIKDQLDLKDTHVLLDNQRLPIPTDSGVKNGSPFGGGPFDGGIYVVVSYVSGKPIGNNVGHRWDAGLAKMFEVQEMTMHHLIQVDVMSFDASARTGKEDVMRALSSFYSQERQNAQHVSFGRLPAFANASNLEDPGMQHRYTMTFPVTSINRFERETSYYDKFPTTSTAEPSVVVNK